METKKQKLLLELSINDESYELAVGPQETLLEVLRNHLGLTGTKEGCDTGECGSCTVLIDGKPVLSCLTLALNCRNKKIVTIEGLGKEGAMTIVQNAFLEKGAVQCGFCTPGMVLATTALLEEMPAPSDRETKKALEGHLCRCTGYNKILEAVGLAVARSSGGSAGT